jgi:uncharacterized membrane protein HdeD (DUF308 family)
MVWRLHSFATMTNRDNRGFSRLAFIPPADVAQLRKDWAWFLMGGIISCVLGIFAWRAPVIASAGLAAALGVILLISGVVQLVQTFQFSRYGGTAWRVFQSLISIVGGFIMLRYPVIGIMGVGLTIIFYLFMSAASQMTLSFATRPIRGSGLLLVSSLISLALGVLLVAQLPFSALWVPGVFLAIDLLIGGISLITLSLKFRSLRIEQPPTAALGERRAA